MPDSEIVSHLLEKPENAAPATSQAARGPLDITSPETIPGAAAYWLAAHTPEFIKYPASQVAGWLNRRLSATTAAALEPFAPAVQAADQALKERYAQQTGQPAPTPLPPMPKMESVPNQAKQLAEAAFLGRSPIPGVPAELATDELVRRTLGEYHALTPEQADKISRAAGGLPVGEVGRALTGNEGISLLAQAPAMGGMNAIGGGIWPVAMAASENIPAIGVARAVGKIKTQSVRRMLAEQAEQHLALKPLQEATQAVAKKTGETFEQVDNRIREARMLEPQDLGAAMSKLSPEEQAIAQGYKDFGASQVAKDVAEKLRPGVRHAHIEAQRRRALAAVAEAKAAQKYVDELGQAEIPVPMGGAGSPIPPPITKKFTELGGTEEDAAAAARAMGDPLLRKMGLIPDKRPPRFPEEIGASKSVLGSAHTMAKTEARIAKRRITKLNQSLETSGISIPVRELTAAEQGLQKLPSKLTGHAAAIRTPESLAATRELKGQPWWNRAKYPIPKNSVTKVAQITGNRTLTAGQKDALIQKELMAAGKPAQPSYATGFESELRRGDFRASRRASAMMFRDIADKFGTVVPEGAPVPKGQVFLSNLRIGKSGFAKDEMKRLSRIAVPEKVFRQAEAITKTLGDSSLGDAKNFVQKASRAWKTYILARTGYTVRNVGDNLGSIWMFGAKSGYEESAAKAILLAEGLGGNSAEYIPELKMTLGEYVASARRNGALTGGFISGEAIGTKGMKAGLGKKALDKWRQGNAMLENYSRVLLDMSKRAAGSTADEAGETVDWALGKYHPAFLSPLEQKVNNYVFPWYNWIKQIVKRSTRLAVERPGSVAQVASLPTEVNRAQGWTPEQMALLGPDVKASGALLRTHGLKEGVAEVFPTSVYGPTDINRMFGFGELGPAAILANPVGQSYPGYQWAVALAKNPRNFKDWTGEDVELPGTAAGLVRFPELAKSLGVKLEGKRPIGPDRLNYFMRQFGPAAMALSDLGSDDPQASRRARSFWTGFSSYLRSLDKSQLIKESVELKGKKEEADTYKKSLLNKLNREQQFLLERTAQP